MTGAQRAKLKADREIASAVKRALREAGLGPESVSVGRDAVRITVSRAKAERLVTSKG